jgi:hypothetical protein
MEKSRNKHFIGYSPSYVFQWCDCCWHPKIIQLEQTLGGEDESSGVAYGRGAKDITYYRCLHGVDVNHTAAICALYIVLVVDGCSKMHMCILTQWLS